MCESGGEGGDRDENEGMVMWEIEGERLLVH